MTIDDTTPRALKPEPRSPASELASRIAREQVRQQLFGDVGSATTIGRFQVLEQIGAGGMGAVFTAYDPRLDRKVALKLLVSSEPGPDDEGHARLLREARIMAKLDHPNIVTVLDVGVHEGGVYVAMEFVRGCTFAQWLEQEDPPWSMVLDRFLQAGRGLAAAHRDGVLHRDFKPSNVMIDGDGRARVLDFGLAVTKGEPVGQPRTEDNDLDTGQLTPSSRGSLTRTGMVLGTPLYMAPECISGGSAGPASDQYAYCISLWQALFGAHPFARPTLSALHAAMLEGERPQVPASASSAVPAWVRAIVERGLARQPATRWPSMDALLEALARDPTRARRRWAWRSAALLAIAGVTFGAYRLGELPSEACVLGLEALAGTWGGQRREQVEAAIVASAVTYAATVAPRVTAELDSYAERWLAESKALCEATRGSLALSPAHEERSRACLEQRRRSLAALVDVLAEVDAGAVEHAVTAVEALPAPEPCTDPGHLATAEALPRPEIADEVQALEETIAELDALIITGSPAGLRPRAQQAAEQAERLDHPPLRARALLTLGHVQVSAGEYPEAERTLEAAFLRARATRVDDVARKAAGLLAHLLGITVKRPDEALLWAKQACADAERTEDQLGRAQCLLDLGGVQAARRDSESAIETYREALAIYEREGGSDHSGVGWVLNTLGHAMTKAQRPDEAIDVLERALALHERTLGPDHTRTAMSHGYLGVAHEFAGRPERALEYHERALAIMVATLGELHPDVAITHQNLSRTLNTLHRYDEALVRTEQARAIWERVLGPEHPNVGSLHFNQGNALIELSRYAEAAEHFARAHAILSKGPEAMQVRGCAALVGLAHADIKQGHYEDALAHAERGLARCDALRAGPETLAPARFLIAQALLATGRDRARALALGHRARREFAELGVGYAHSLSQVDRWLAEHAPASSSPNTPSPR